MYAYDSEPPLIAASRPKTTPRKRVLPLKGDTVFQSQIIPNGGGLANPEAPKTRLLLLLQVTLECLLGTQQGPLPVPAETTVPLKWPPPSIQSQPRLSAQFEHVTLTLVLGIGGLAFLPKEKYQKEQEKESYSSYKDDTRCPVE